MDDARVIAVVGTKGGCGGTLVAANLAAAMVARGSVCAIDLDFARGDLAGMLDLTPLHPLPELIGNPFDATLLLGCALQHVDGFSVLGQPRELSRLVRASRAEVDGLIAVARGAWDALVLDGGSRIDEALVSAVSCADQVLIVTTPDVLAFRNLVRLRALLEHGLHLPPDRIRIVMNKAVAHMPAVDEFAELAGVTISANLRFEEKAARSALDEGRVVRSVAPRSMLARDLDGLWRSLLDLEPEPQHWHLPWIGGTQ